MESASQRRISSKRKKGRGPAPRSPGLRGRTPSLHSAEHRWNRGARRKKRSLVGRGRRSPANQEGRSTTLNRRTDAPEDYGSGGRHPPLLCVVSPSLRKPTSAF